MNNVVGTVGNPPVTSTQKPAFSSTAGPPPQRMCGTVPLEPSAPVPVHVTRKGGVERFWYTPICGVLDTVERYPETATSGVALPSRSPIEITSGPMSDPTLS